MCIILFVLTHPAGLLETVWRLVLVTRVVEGCLLDPMLPFPERDSAVTVRAGDAVGVAVGVAVADAGVTNC